MLNNQRTISVSRTRDEETEQTHQNGDGESSPVIREIHALSPPPSSGGRRREAWETGSHRSSSPSRSSSEINFSSMSREFNALVLAGSTISSENEIGAVNNLGRIGEEENLQEETNPLAIVPDINPLQPPRGGADRVLAVPAAASGGDYRVGGGELSVQSVKKEEVVSKISAWQNAKIAKVNNRFKRDDAVINGWEAEQVQKASSWMKKEERKLEEKRAKALEKMQNEIAQAHRKAEERRASAEAKRGTKVAKILEIANLMKTVGRAPVKRSFF